jgi:ferric-dicitrate binding protein FerR (iron transport regulator)
MSDFPRYHEIAGLITKEVINGLSVDESNKLMAWLDESPENHQLYSRLKNSAYFNSRNGEYQKINIPVGWETVLELIEKRRKVVLLRRVLSYAAAIVMPLVIAGGIYYATSSAHKNKDIAHVQTIKPGSMKALLTLDNGKVLQLDTINTLSFREKDGTLVEKKGGKLNYTNVLNDQTSDPVYNTLSVPRGGEYNLVLADGTHVYLNAMSSFKYPVKFSGKSREVELSGEAYLEVKKDTSKPFIIKTQTISIEVLGTSFNLNAYENTESVITTLVEGRVRINSLKTNESQLLAPDEQATFNIKSGLTDIKKVDVNLYTAWRNGNLTFYDSRLEDIMTTLTRWYSAKVLYMDASVKELRFSGNLNRYGDINQILEIIRSTGKINIEIDKDTILFSERN